MIIFNSLFTRLFTIKSSKSLHIIFLINNDRCAYKVRQLFDQKLPNVNAASPMDVDRHYRWLVGENGSHSCETRFIVNVLKAKSPWYTMEPFSVSSSESQTRFERLRKARILFEGIRSPLFSFERDFTKIYPSIVQTILFPVKFLLFDAIDDKFFFFSFESKNELHLRLERERFSHCLGVLSNWSE